MAAEAKLQPLRHDDEAKAKVKRFREQKRRNQKAYRDRKKNKVKNEPQKHTPVATVDSPHSMQSTSTTTNTFMQHTPSPPPPPIMHTDSPHRSTAPQFCMFQPDQAPKGPSQWVSQHADAALQEKRLTMQLYSQLQLSQKQKQEMTGRWRCWGQQCHASNRKLITALNVLDQNLLQTAQIIPSDMQQLLENFPGQSRSDCAPLPIQEHHTASAPLDTFAQIGHCAANGNFHACGHMAQSSTPSPTTVLGPFSEQGLPEPLRTPSALFGKLRPHTARSMQWERTASPSDNNRKRSTHTVAQNSSHNMHVLHTSSAWEVKSPCRGWPEVQERSTMHGLVPSNHMSDDNMHATHACEIDSSMLSMWACDERLHMHGAHVLVSDAFIPAARRSDSMHVESTGTWPITSHHSQSNGNVLVGASSIDVPETDANIDDLFTRMTRTGGVTNDTRASLLHSESMRTVPKDPASLHGAASRVATGASQLQPSPGTQQSPSWGTTYPISQACYSQRVGDTGHGALQPQRVASHQLSCVNVKQDAHIHVHACIPAHEHGDTHLQRGQLCMQLQHLNGAMKQPVPRQKLDAIPLGLVGESGVTTEQVSGAVGDLKEVHVGYHEALAKLLKPLSGLNKGQRELLEAAHWKHKLRGPAVLPLAKMADKEVHSGALFQLLREADSVPGHRR